MEILGLIVAFASLGVVVGLYWRWRLRRLLAVCVAVGLLAGLVAALSDPGGTLSEILADARFGGSAWESYCTWGGVFFVYTGVPMAIGGTLGNRRRASGVRPCQR